MTPSVLYLAPQNEDQGIIIIQASRRIIWIQADQMEGSYCIATTPGVSECQQIQVSTP